RRHTRSDRDWSSDVCSSDLGADFLECAQPGLEAGATGGVQAGAVGLVIGRLIDDADAELHAQLDERLAYADVEVVRLDNAGPREIGRASCRERVETWRGAGA